MTNAMPYLSFDMPSFLLATQLTQEQLSAIYFQVGFGIFGFVAGLFMMWLILRAKFAGIKVRHEEQSRSAEKSIADLEAGSANLEDELSELRNTESILLKRQGELEANVSGHKRRHAEQQQLLADMESRFANTFRSLSSDALQNSQKQLVTIAQQALQAQQQESQGVLEKRNMAVEQLITPVAQSLEKMQSRVGEIEQSRENAYSSVLEQVRHMAESQASLNKETHRLVRALRPPSGRGQWGEMQLKRCVEMAGMQEHCEFLKDPLHDRNKEAEMESNQLRPDLLVKLPGFQQVVVDAKAPMGAYLDALEADEDNERDALLMRHAQQISEHIQKLASPDYLNQFENAPEFTVLFLPSESFFSAALNHDPSLIEKGVDQGVILATPTTLIALLRAVSYGWRQEALAEDARQISILGGDLYQRLTTLTEHFSHMGHSLDNTVKVYNQAMSSLETKVLPGARKFEELGAANTDQPIADLPRIEVQARNLTFTSDDKFTHDIQSVITDESSKESFEGFVVSEPEKEASEQTNQKDEKANAAADDLRAALEGSN